MEASSGADTREFVENAVWLAVYVYALACLLVWTLNVGVLALVEHGVRSMLSALQQGSPLLWAHVGVHSAHYGTALMLALLPHETRQALHSLNAFSVGYVWAAAAVAWWDVELLVALRRRALAQAARHRAETTQAHTGVRTTTALVRSLATRLWSTDAANAALQHTQNDTLRHMLRTLHGRYAVLVLLGVQHAGRHYRSLSTARQLALLVRVALASTGVVYATLYCVYDVHLSQLFFADDTHAV